MISISCTSSVKILERLAPAIVISDIRVPFINIKTFLVACSPNPRIRTDDLTSTPEYKFSKFIPENLPKSCPSGKCEFSLIILLLIIVVELPTTFLSIIVG